MEIQTGLICYCPPAGEGPAAVESAAVDAAVEAAVQGERTRTDTEG